MVNLESIHVNDQDIYVNIIVLFCLLLLFLLILDICLHIYTRLIILFLDSILIMVVKMCGKKSEFFFNVHVKLGGIILLNMFNITNNSNFCMFCAKVV